MSSLAEQLLSEIESEEVTNPDVGQFHNVTFNGGDLGVTKNGGYQLIARFSIIREDSTTFNIKDYINLPKSDSHPVVKKMGLGWYHALGLVPEGNKNIPLASTREIAEKIVEAANSCAGAQLGVSVTEDDRGQLRVRPLRKTAMN